MTSRPTIWASATRGSRLVATTANGCPAFGSYRVHPDGGWSPWAIQVLEVSGGLIVGHHNFVDPALFAAFGLPDHLEPDHVRETDEVE